MSGRRSAVDARLDDLSGQSSTPDLSSVRHMARSALPRMAGPLLPQSEEDRTRLQGRLISRPRRREQLATGRGIEEGRVRTLGQLGQPCTDQGGEQLVCEDGAVTADGALVARRSKIRNLYGRRCRFLVKDDHVPRAWVLGHVE